MVMDWKAIGKDTHTIFKLPPTTYILQHDFHLLNGIEFSWLDAWLSIWQCFISLYRLFAGVVYLSFLGIVVLLLVIVFIAQATASYNGVQGIADQRANYASARLLTQTSSTLPILLISYITVNILKYFDR